MLRVTIDEEDEGPVSCVVRLFVAALVRLLVCIPGLFLILNFFNGHQKWPTGFWGFGVLGFDV